MLTDIALLRGAKRKFAQPFCRSAPAVFMSAIQSNDFIAISPAMLSPKSLPGVNIFIKSNQDSTPTLFCSSDSCASPERLHELSKSGVTKLFIRSSERDDYQAYLRENWEDLVANTDRDPTAQISVISEVMRDVLREGFNGNDTNCIVEACQQVGKAASQVVEGPNVAISKLSNVLHHDFTTFTHCTNVSLYCTLLAKALGYSGTELEEISIGGLLHDVGKLQIDNRILTKPGRLDEAEFREVQRHPLAGFEQLTHCDSVTFGQLMMAYQHHERIDGSGYPVGCVGSEIHPLARLCAIVDVYEALTARRPYREPMSESTVMSLLNKGSGTEFDPEMLTCWQQQIAL